MFFNTSNLAGIVLNPPPCCYHRFPDVSVLSNQVFIFSPTYIYTAFILSVIVLLSFIGFIGIVACFLCTDQVLIISVVYVSPPAPQSG